MYKRGCILTLIGLAAQALASEAELDNFSGRGHYPVEYCQGLCDDNKECRHDKHGSYCKSWQDPPVCFGFYHKKPHGYCFEPNDPKCNDAKLDPVKCGHKVGKKGYCQELCEKVDSCRKILMLTVPTAKNGKMWMFASACIILSTGTASSQTILNATTPSWSLLSASNAISDSILRRLTVSEILIALLNLSTGL